ncbi:MAG: hypothetical protein H6974_12395 [Gammaproteobacteria bacterium]|nr:hypothetical protein [Gammaproteobacteria bacterium]
MITTLTSIATIFGGLVGTIFAIYEFIHFRDMKTAERKLALQKTVLEIKKLKLELGLTNEQSLEVLEQNLPSEESSEILEENVLAEETRNVKAKNLGKEHVILKFFRLLSLVVSIVISVLFIGVAVSTVGTPDGETGFYVFCGSISAAFISIAFKLYTTRWGKYENE